MLAYKVLEDIGWKKVKGYLLLCDCPFIYVVKAISPWFLERLTLLLLIMLVAIQ